MLLTLLLIGIIFFLFYYLFIGKIDSVNPGEHFTFEEMKFSTQEFYTLVGGLIKAKEIPSVQLLIVEHNMAGLLSARRYYLRIKYMEYFFDICAAPFARDFFVSWRQGTLRQFTIGKRKYKTFYEQDTELMFKESIKLCVHRAIKHISEEKGIRVNTEGVVPLVN